MSKDLLSLKDVRTLIQAGKKFGFLTHDEINEKLPDEVVAEAMVDELFEVIKRNGIAIVENIGEAEKRGFIKPGEGANLLKKEAESKITDPVRMYLRKMGCVALLTRQGEVEIAKKIEQGELEVLNQILRLELGIQAIISVVERLESGEVHVRDVSATSTKRNRRLVPMRPRSPRPSSKSSKVPRPATNKPLIKRKKSTTRP